MGSRWLGPLALAALVLASGCGGLEPRPEPPASAGKISTKPVALPDVTVSYEPTAPGKARGSLRPALDAATISGHVARLLRERGSASDVAVVASGTAPPAGSVQLLVTLESAQIRYEGQSGVFPVKVGFVVMFFPFDVPNYFIASDRYTLVARGHWKLVDLESAHTVAEGDAEGRETGVFGDMSRGWHFLGFVRSPGCLDPEDWERIGARLCPGGEEAFATAVVVSVEKAVGAEKATGTEKAPDAAAAAARPASGE